MGLTSHRGGVSETALGGVAVAAVSAICFGTSGPLAKSLIDIGWSATAIALARLAVGSVVLWLPLLIFGRNRLRTCAAAPWAVVAYGLFGVAVAQLCFFNAVRYLEVPVALLIEYLGTVFVVGWEWLVRRAHPTLVTLCGCVIAIAAMVLVIGGGATGRIDPVGVAWALGAAIGLAGYFILASGGSNGAHVDPLAQAAVGLAIGAILIGAVAAAGLLPMAGVGGSAQLAGAEVPWWAVIIAVAVISTSFAYATGVVAVRMLGSLVASFVALLEVVASAVGSWVLLGQTMTWLQIIGALVLLGGVCLVRLGGLVRPRAIRRSGARQGQESVEPPMETAQLPSEI